jgi:hypothetical protein
VNHYPDPKLVLDGMDMGKDEAVLEAREEEVGRLSHVRWWKEREVISDSKDETKMMSGQQMCSRTYLEQRRPVVFVLVKKRGLAVNEERRTSIHRSAER